jgi:pyruvate carboxylase
MLQILLAAPLAAALSLPAQMHRATMRSGPAAAASFSPIQMVASAEVDADAEPCDVSSDVKDMSCGGSMSPKAPFKKIMAANRAEIAVRIMRAATELNMETVAIYGYEDRYSQHRWGADQSFMLKPAETAVKAYLDVEQVVSIAKENGVDAIHPGYGFLSESPEMVQACNDAGITFIGPTVEVMNKFADKTAARAEAIKAGVPVVPGTDSSVTDPKQLTDFVAEFGLPIIMKAAMGGGGKGMRVVREEKDLIPFFESATSEAEAAFGDGAVFVERFVNRPRHIEIQIIGDGKGDAVHLWERDCSVQRRYQKVVEIAPAWNLSPELRKQMQDDALRLVKGANYLNAGTVEFLVEPDGKYYFIEVNPRIQVEHTVTEQVTGIDIVQAQMRIAGGASFAEMGLLQENIHATGIAMQCRITTENAERNFTPDTGTLSVYRHSAGFGMRMDGIGYSGMVVQPYYDSLLVKYTASGGNWEEVVRRMKRALQEARIRGVKTNIPFLLNVLSHPVFEAGVVTTSFIDENPELLKITGATWNFKSGEQSDQKNVFQVERLMRYLANVAVNGHPTELGADATKLEGIKPIPAIKPIVADAAPAGKNWKGDGWRKVLLESGPEGLSKAVRNHEGTLLTDTTYRDAHQSLLATRMRTQELVHAAETTNDILKGCFSMEMWGGATFDVAMRFLHECPWRRLETLREAVPDVPFQMLLRGANAVGYTNYPDNVVKRFCAQAASSGVDIFRVFDSLNYIENMKLGVEAVGEAGGFIEAAICYTGDVAAPGDGMYNLEYYLDYARKLDELGVHSIAIKDMAGLLTPRGATILVGALRAELPNMPIHMHTHDTAGVGVASMIAAAEAGADVVDVAIDGMSGLTSQPSMGAVVASLRNTELDTGLGLDSIEPLGTYWDDVRGLYLPFESGQLAGTSDVYVHEIPGGQYTNLLFQSKQLGLSEKWAQIKLAYAQANLLLGDIPKVTPSSKVVGDLAQFMVSQNLTPEQVIEGASTLALPGSVVEFFQGVIGVPPAGFPEPLTSRVRKGRSLPDGTSHYEGRPGADMADYDFEEAEKALVAKYGVGIRPQDVMSHAMYPKVFADWQTFMAVYGEVEVLPTTLFLKPMKEGDEVTLEISKGRQFFIKLVSLPPPSADGIRQVIMELNGERWFVGITDNFADLGEGARREKATSDDGSIGSPMPGVIVDVKVKIGDVVAEGEPLVVLSAMKMETVLPSPRAGVVTRVLHNAGDQVDPDDLLLLIEDEVVEKK